MNNFTLSVANASYLSFHGLHKSSPMPYSLKGSADTAQNQKIPLPTTLWPYRWGERISSVEISEWLPIFLPTTASLISLDLVS